MPRISLILTMLAFLGTTHIVMAAAEENGWNEAGIRVGFQEGTRNEYFRQYEVFAVHGLPWDWRASSGWGVDTNFEISAGALQGGSEVGFMGTAGPGISLNKSGKGLALDLGINIDILDRCKFINQNFGGNLLFGAYMGLSYRFEDWIKVGYRIQHISNGHIFYSYNTPNPGLDTHLVGVSLNF